MLGIEFAEALLVGLELLLHRHVVYQLPVVGQLLEPGVAVLKVAMHLLTAEACIHMQDVHAVLVQRAVNAPQIGEIEREAHAVVEAQQERRDDAALA